MPFHIAEAAAKRVIGSIHLLPNELSIYQFFCVTFVDG